MDRSAELFEPEPCLIEAARRCRRDILTEDGECLPQCVSLESQYNLDVGLTGHTADQFQIAAQP